MSKEKEIELVDTHCKHKDCVYRKTMNATRGKDCCMYAAIEHAVRGCKISECNRYTPGRKIRPRLEIGTEIYWEYEIGSGDIDIFE